MNLLNKLMLNALNPAIFHVVHVPSADILLCVTANELARDCASVTGSTQSFILTDEVKARILRECGTEGMGTCGAMFVSADMKSFVPARALGDDFDACDFADEARKCDCVAGCYKCDW